MRSRVCNTYVPSLRWQINSIKIKNACYFIYRPNDINIRHTSTTTQRTFRESARCAINKNSTPGPDTSSLSNLGESQHQAPLQVAEKSAIKSIQNVLVNASSPYTVHGAAGILFKECSKHAAYKTPLVGTDKEIPTTEDGEEIGVSDEGALWHREFCFPATFSTWSQVTMLHLYLFTARIRNAPPDQVKIWQQCIQDQFFWAAEDRMVVNHNIQASSVRNKYLKDLYVQWRGLIAAYDEGLAKGDAVLAAAIWRNLFKAREDFDVRYLAQITSYMRHSLQKLDALPSVMNLMDFKFGNLAVEKALVMESSQMMKQPF